MRDTQLRQLRVTPPSGPSSGSAATSLLSPVQEGRVGVKGKDNIVVSTVGSYLGSKPHLRMALKKHFGLIF